MLYTIDKTADVLGLSAKSIRNNISKGTWPIPTAVLMGRRLMRADDVNALIDRVLPRDHEAPALNLPKKSPRGRPRKIAQEGGAA